jgi:hypothetical protein
MSLWRNRGPIARAVVGLLTLDDERKLFAHLRKCGECRRHYDVVTAIGRILAGRPQHTLASERRERARLVAAIGS